MISFSIGSIKCGKFLSELLLFAIRIHSARVGILCLKKEMMHEDTYLRLSCSAVHRAIAGAGVCAQHPQGGVPFNPATGFGVPAIPFSSWPAACTQPLPPTAHTVPAEQANVQIFPESSDQLVTETKG